MSEHLEAWWGPYLEGITDACRQSPRVVAHFHMPKTGGSTFIQAMHASPAWRCIYLPATYVELTWCPCRREGCPAFAQRRATLNFSSSSDSAVSPLPIFLKFDHEKYSSVRWLKDRVSQSNTSFEVVTVVRPIRQRLVSMFTDYWTKVFTADRYLSGEIDLTPHEVGVAMGYFNDAAHYRDGRSIDGELWFRAFVKYGAGVPFLMSQVFGDPSNLTSALESGDLRAIPIGQLDTFASELLGGKIPDRRRVSITPSSVLSRAVQGAREVIDEIVAQELPWDRVIADHLGDRSFAE